MKPMIIDCFAGGGGASTGIEEALGRDVDIAINHDPEAIRMHKVNHPNTLHLTEDIFAVDLKKYVNGERVGLMWASPDCTSHSKAKGGKPRNNGLRILPWAVYKHAQAILPDVIIMENVEEIQKWGPLDDKGYPIKDLEGIEYNKFINKMKSLGYKFDSRELIAADYGAPTTRKRWYAIFRRDGKDICWPKQTHNKYGTNDMEKWVPVSTVLDFSDLGNSIFGRKKPLAENTMNRIAKGLKKFVFENPDPFIVQVNHLKNFKNQNVHKCISTATHNRKVKDLPNTVVTKTGHYFVTPALIQYHSETTVNGVRGQSVSDPIKTIDTSNRYAQISAFLTKFYTLGVDQSLFEEIHTITTSSGSFGRTSVLTVNISDLIASGISEEVAQKCTWVSNFIMEYYGCGIGSQLKDPVHTIVTKDRFALITVLGNEYVILDIFLRMLTPEELKLGQGFPKDYIIDRDINWKKYPKTQQVARIGNSVVPIMAKKLVEANCSYLKIGERIPNLLINDSEPQLRFG